MSTTRVRVRALTQAVRQSGRGGEPLSASALAQIGGEKDCPVPHAEPDAGEEQLAKSAGIWLGKAFKDAEVENKLVIDGIIVERVHVNDCEGRAAKRYVFGEPQEL